MIAFVEGGVAALGADSVVLDAGGVGYRVFCGPGTLATLREGSPVRLLTHHLVRDDQQSLYGFRTPEELGFFELLITVTGVGPRVALAIVSSRPVTDLQLAVFQGDEAVLTAVPGVGRKLAARVILELKEKVSVAGGAAGVAAGRDAPGAAESEVVAALQALGYSSGEAREAGRGAVAALPAGASLEERVKAALRALRRD
ncbi:MAG: Holliday junction branch migration protein RuvA [Chloroflexota bacterium]|nr:Holliday junction branch migration protein RuvA [Chloroflexota bacterium]